MGRFITILGKGTTNLPREIAPRKKSPPPKKKKSVFYFLKTSKIKEWLVEINPSQVPLEASRGCSR